VERRFLWRRRLAGVLQLEESGKIAGEPPALRKTIAERFDAFRF
jgi:hypothetical protein